MGRDIEFSEEDNSKEYFTEVEYSSMLDSFKEDEFYVAAALIADKACEHLQFTDQQKELWRGQMINAITKDYNNPVIAKINTQELKLMLKSTLLSSIQNYAKAEKEHQDSLNAPPPEE